MELSWQEYWSGFSIPPLGYLPNPGIEPASPALSGGFFTAELVKNLPAIAGVVAEAVDSIPELGRSPGEGNAIHFNILAWKIPWIKEPGKLESMGSPKSQACLSD